MKTAICPGSFDPVTLGHMDIIRRASKIFDKVIVAVMVNPAKKTAFTLDERVALLKKATAEMDSVEVVGFDGFLADLARKRGACAIVKGLRAVSDFEYEFQMALINQKLNSELETMFLTTQAQNMYLSSSIVREIGHFGGEIAGMVPAVTEKYIAERLKKQ